MSQEPQVLDDDFVEPNTEVRDTIIKSSLSGVAFTVFAVVACSPAGLGGMIGTSVAGLGWNSLDPNNTGHDAVTFPTAAPLTDAELQTIRDRLATGTAALDNLRAATDAEIDFMRSIAASDNVLAFQPPSIVAQAETAAPQTVAVVAPDRDLELAELLLANRDS